MRHYVWKFGIFFVLGVLSGEEEINSSQKSFQTNLEILFEELRLTL